MNQKKTTGDWIKLFAIYFGPVACVCYCELFAQAVMAQQREAATPASRNQEPTSSKSPDVKIEEPEPGVKLFGDPVAINLSHPAFGFTISNDGSILVAGERTPSLYFWSLTENRLVRTLEKPEKSSIWFPSLFSASGAVLAATYQTWKTRDEKDENTEIASSWMHAATTVLFLNKDGQIRSEVEVDEGFASHTQRTIAFSPNEKFFLLGGPQNATVVDVDSGEIVAQLSNFRDPVFIGNQTLISVASNEIWNFHTDKLFRSPTPVFPRNSTLCFTSSNGQWSFIDVRGQGGMLVHLPDGKRIPISEIQDSFMGSFSSDGSYLAVSGYAPGNRDHRWLVYDTKEEKILGKPVTDSASVAMRGNLPQVIVWHGAFRTINLAADTDLNEQWQRIKNSPIQAHSIHFGNRDQTIIGGQFTLDLTRGKFRRYDRFMRSILPLDDEPGLVFVNFEQRQPLLLGFHRDQQYEIVRLDLVEGKLRNLYRIRPRPSLSEGLHTVLGVENPAQPIMINSIRIFHAADAGVLYDVRTDSSAGLFLKSFDLKKNQPLADVPLEIPKDLVTDQASIATMSGDRKRTAVAIGREIWVANSQTGDLEQNWEIEKEALQLRMDQTGTRLAVIYPSQSVNERHIGREFVVYDVAEKRILHTERTDAILALEFHPQRPQLMVATGGTENRWRALDANSGKQLSERSTRYSQALSAAFSKDGNQMAWGLQDTRIELWDLRRVK